MQKKEGRIISFRYNFKEYLTFVGKYKSTMFFLLLTVFLIELIVIGEKYLFKVIVDKGTDFESGILIFPEFTHLLFILLVIYIIVIITNLITTRLYEKFLIDIECNMIRDLKVKYFNHIVNLDYGFHVSHKTGSLISRLGRGANAIERITDQIIFNFAPLIFQVSIISLTLYYLDSTTSFIVLFIVLIFIGFSYYIQRIQLPYSVEKNAAEDIEKANVADIFTNIDTIKYFGKEKFIAKKFFKLTETTRQKTHKNWSFYIWLKVGHSLIIGLGTIFILCFPLIRLLQKEITIGTLTFIYTSFIGLVNPLKGFTHGVKEFYRCMADFEGIFKYGRIQKQITDVSDAKELMVRGGEIEFRNVSFSYDKRTIFKELNLKIRSNEKVAFVGHSGSGKTTLVKLLYRLYDINSGQILIDGKDIRSCKQESLRSSMSIVPQECILFDDTIYNNVAFSSPRATSQSIIRAMKFAQLNNVFMNFPLKEQTIVGERGVKLSGGEKQRVSIARALLANKKILVLDEATSALDSQTEHDIHEDLVNLMASRTAIIIAHRLSTIMHADRIIVLCRGKIVQEGTHDELINQEGEYKKLWTLQKGGYI